MRSKRILVVSALSILLSTSCIAASTHSVCACITVNDSVVGNLNQLDALAQQYSAEHGGLFPTYDELRAMAGWNWLDVDLTSRVDFVTRAFTFTPTRNDIGKVGYAVSADRRDYVLVGVGLNVTEVYVLGYGPISVSYQTPILHPGDTPPEPSPVKP